ncbi:tyrosine-type recombinase/integrase [Aneurinibacillus aneurinilyticus]|uniref:tyrosine-type recombinase/integrase n=1 Tax=Aneurinibacillus aneurinilyticus TaxID=1391 RepID=UPI0023EF8465|nr:tyrosine-type recombinase/integrase [Aneurinibacillus aneurinilyticus]
MDKRFLSSNRDIRGRKRARLSDDIEFIESKTYKSPTYHDIFNRFMELKRSEGMSPRREEMFIQHKKYFVDFLRRKRYSELMKDITLSVLRNWMIDMQEQYVVYQTHIRGGKRKGLAPKTINTRLKDMKHFFNVAFENGWVEKNEAAPLKTLKEPIDTVEGLTEEQVKAMLNVCNKKSYTGFRDYVMILLAVDTGLRQAEMLSLTTKNFDFETGVVKVEEDIAKNNKARIVPISRKVLIQIQKLLYENNLSFRSDRLFLTAYGEPMTSRGVVRQFSTIRKNAGLDGVKATCHALRHTFAKFYVQAGGDPFTLQRILGHSRMDIVRMYIQMNADDIVSAHKKFSPASKFRI